MRGHSCRRACQTHKSQYVILHRFGFKEVLRVLPRVTCPVWRDMNTTAKQQLDAGHSVQMQTHAGQSIALNIFCPVWPWSLTFWPENHNTSRISWDHFMYQVWRIGIICFWVMQTHRRADERSAWVINCENHQIFGFNFIYITYLFIYEFIYYIFIYIYLTLNVTLFIQLRSSVVTTLASEHRQISSAARKPII